MMAENEVDHSDQVGVIEQIMTLKMDQLSHIFLFPSQILLYPNRLFYVLFLHCSCWSPSLRIEFGSCATQQHKILAEYICQHFDATIINSMTAAHPRWRVKLLSKMGNKYPANLCNSNAIDIERRNYVLVVRIHMD